MDLTKEIKLTKKLIVFLILLNVIVIGISYSYALFEVSVVKNSIVRIQTANIIMTLTSTDLENNKSLTLNGNETKEITLTITNESEINALARLYYIGDGDLTFKSDTDFKDKENIGIGQINKGESKTITIEITNNSASSVTIELGAQEGLIGYELTLNEGRNSIILEDLVVIATDKIITKVGNDGLVAINTEGELYSGTGEIREYRYSGTNVNNYIYFNCKDNDGTYDYGDKNYNYESNCETWRIVGIFNEDSEQVVKIIRNTTLTSEELPASYVVDGTSFTIEAGTTGYAYWNSTKTGTNKNDWTTAGLQYFLNSENDTSGTAGYLSILTKSAKELIRTTTYYLGNFVSLSQPQELYTGERDASNIYSGNKATWSGKVALLYPSDYAYSVDSSYWGTTEPEDTTWMPKDNGVELEWLLSPAPNGDSTDFVLLRASSVGYGMRESSAAVRPCLYLVSNSKILLGTGESTNPYVVIS